MIAPYDPVTNPEGGAEWTYLADNVRMTATTLVPYAELDQGLRQRQGRLHRRGDRAPARAGAPAGISQLQITDIVSESNRWPTSSRPTGADIVVLLVHEGAAETNCSTMDDDPTSDFGSIINGVNENVDAIISGHTHLAYNCSFQVDEWAGRSVTDRPVVSAGQYGMALNRLVFTVDSATGEVQAQDLLAVPPAQGRETPGRRTTRRTRPPAIVAAAVANAEVLGAGAVRQPGWSVLPRQAGRRQTDNRGAESTLGNLVAEVQKWATRSPESGASQIAFMNPGGLRQDMTGSAAGVPADPDLQAGCRWSSRSQTPW